jgi:hypothetical protein
VELLLGFLGAWVTARRSGAEKGVVVGQNAAE